MASSILYTAALFGASAHAMAWFGPRATTTPEIPSDAVTPKPTTAPYIPPELLRRATSASVETRIIGPDNTCGFVSASSGAPISCPVTDSCVFFPSYWGTAGAAGCCNDNGCGIRQACLDYTQYSSQSLCTGACPFDTATVKCTATSEKYCQTLVWLGSIYDYFCDSNSINTVLVLNTTYSGEKDGRTWSTAVVTLTSTASTTSSSTGRTTTTPSANSIPSSTSPSSTSSSSSTSTTSPAASSGGSSTPVGAIVGGVVGGIAAIGIVALALVFLLRRNRNNNNNNNVTNNNMPPPGGPMPPMGEQHPPPTSPPYGPADPSKMAYGGYPTPPNGSGYPSPNPSSPQQFQQTPSPGPMPGQQGYYSPGQQHPDRLSSASPGYDRTSNISNLQPASPMGPLHQGGQPMPYAVATMHPPQPTVYEAGGNPMGGPQDYNANHHGAMHELG